MPCSRHVLQLGRAAVHFTFLLRQVVQARDTLEESAVSLGRDGRRFSNLGIGTLRAVLCGWGKGGREGGREAMADKGDFIRKGPWKRALEEWANLADCIAEVSGWLEEEASIADVRKGIQ